jgi:hypothetical protein
VEVTPFSVTKELLIDRIDALLQAVIRLAQGYFGGNFAYSAHFPAHSLSVLL